MKVKPLNFLFAIVFAIITIEVVATREPVSWWLCAIMALGITLDEVVKCLEDS